MREWLKRSEASRKKVANAAKVRKDQSGLNARINARRAVKEADARAKDIAIDSYISELAASGDAEKIRRADEKQKETREHAEQPKIGPKDKFVSEIPWWDRNSEWRTNVAQRRLLKDNIKRRLAATESGRARLEGRYDAYTKEKERENAPRLEPATEEKPKSDGRIVRFLTRASGAFKNAGSKLKAGIKSLFRNSSQGSQTPVLAQNHSRIFSYCPGVSYNFSSRRCVVYIHR